MQFRQPLSAFYFFLGIASLTVICIASPHLKNAGFECPYTVIDQQSGNAEASGEIAHGWKAEVRRGVKFSRESSPEAVREGASAQRIDVSNTNELAELTQRLALIEGDSYRVTVWLRAGGLIPLRLFVREAATPGKISWEQEITVSPEWQAYEFSGVATMRDSILGIALHNVGSVWVDGVQVAPISTTPSDHLAARPYPALSAETAKHNMLPGSSFEAGLSSGWSVYIRNGENLANAALIEYGAADFYIDAATSDHGTCSLRIPIDAGNAVIIASPLAQTRNGYDYTASISLKATHPTKVRISLREAGGNKTISTVEHTIGPSWQRVSLSAKAPVDDALRLFINYAARTRTDIWIDSAQLEEGVAATPYTPPYPFELALAVPRPGAIVFDGETVPLNVRIGTASITRPPLSGEIHLQLEAESMALEPGIPNPRSPLSKTLHSPNTSGQITADLALAADYPRPRGVFKLRGLLVNGAGQPISSPVEVTFARLPPPANIPSEESFFGTHIPLKPEFIAIAHALGNKWIRLHDATWTTKWAAVEPEEGRFQFADDGIDAARAAGLSILGMLCGAPSWTSVTPRATTGYWSAYNYPDRADGSALWSRYVARTVSHYRGRIDYWEVWNEPWSNGFFQGTPTQYGELLSLAAEAARNENSDARILGFNTAAHKDEWTRKALAATRANAFDIFSFHDYNPTLYGGRESNASRLARKFTDLQLPWGKPRPLWNTEGGPGKIASWYSTSASLAGGLSLGSQIAHIVRFDVTQLAAGVQRSFYYTLHFPPPFGSAEPGYHGLEHDKSIRPIMAARAVLASFVDGAVWIERIEPAPGLEGHVFQRRDGGCITVIWRISSPTSPFSAPAGSALFDVFGNPVSGHPVSISSTPLYLITPP